MNLRKFSAGPSLTLTLSFWRFGRRKIRNRLFWAVKIIRIKIKIKIINDDIIKFNPSNDYIPSNKIKINFRDRKKLPFFSKKDQSWAKIPFFSKNDRKWPFFKNILENSILWYLRDFEKNQLFWGKSVTLIISAKFRSVKITKPASFVFRMVSHGLFDPPSTCSKRKS